jgi:hypothetical protein
MIVNVDKHNDLIVQKVTKPDGKLVRYQVLQQGIYDSSRIKVFMTLESARHAIGKTNGGQLTA